MCRERQNFFIYLKKEERNERRFFEQEKPDGCG